MSVVAIPQNSVLNVSLGEVRHHSRRELQVKCSVQFLSANGSSISVELSEWPAIVLSEEQHLALPAAAVACRSREPDLHFALIDSIASHSTTSAINVVSWPLRLASMGEIRSNGLLRHQMLPSSLSSSQDTPRCFAFGMLLLYSVLYGLKALR